MIFQHPFFTEMLLPFLLIFVVVFAILQKSKILGDGKAQIDAMVSFVIGLITITFTYQTGVIVSLMGWLGLGVAIILLFLILYGFIAGDLSNAPKWMKVTFGVLAGVFSIVVVIYVTGFGGIVSDWFSSNGGEGLFMNVLMVVVVIGAVVAVILSSREKKKTNNS